MKQFTGALPDASGQQHKDQWQRKSHQRPDVGWLKTLSGHSASHSGLATILFFSLSTASEVSRIKWTHVI